MEPAWSASRPGLTRGAEFAALLGVLLVVFVAALLLVASLTFAAGGSLVGAHLPAGGALGVGVAWWATGQRLARPRWRTWVALLATALLGGAAAVGVAGATYDFSHDGQTYHQSAILQLLRGWDPGWGAPLSPLESQHFGIINSYAKGPWICAAALIALTGKIEQGKAFNLLLMAASFCLAWAALRGLLADAWRGTILALVLALNPVSVVQALSYYVDGQLGSLLLCMASLASLAVGGHRPALVGLGAATLILVNVKLSGAAYGILWTAAMIAVGYVAARGRGARAAAGASALGLLLGVGLVGFNPYVTNLLRHGHPLHPVAGASAVDFMTTNMPADFQGRDRVARLVRSVFGESANPLPPASSRLKVPFRVSRREILQFERADVRVGGFGPLFGGAILLAAGVLVLVLLVATPPVRLGLALPLVLVVSTLAHPHGWWARYAPQLWLVPAAAVLLADRASRLNLSGRLSVLVRWTGTAVLLTLVADVALVAGGHFPGQVALNRRLETEMEQLRELVHRSGPVQAAFGGFEATGRRLSEVGIAFEEVRAVSCPRPVRFVNSQAVLCDRTAVTAAEPVLVGRVNVKEIGTIAGRWRGQTPGPDASREVTLVVQPDGRYAAFVESAPAVSGTLRLVRGAIWFPEGGVVATLREDASGRVLLVHREDAVILELVPVP
jgi:hypothetical protein